MRREAASARLCGPEMGGGGAHDPKQQVSTAFVRLADDLTADPVSLMPTDIGAIRQRLFGRANPLPPPSAG